MGQTESKNDIVMPPLYYDPLTVPEGVYRMIDMILQGQDPETISDADMTAITNAFTPSITVTEEMMETSEWHGQTKIYNIKKGYNQCDIFQVISHDPNCVLWGNSQIKIPLGVGSFSFLKQMALCTSFSIEHSTSLLDDEGKPLLLEIKFYCIADKRKMHMPDYINFVIGGKLYAMGSGAVGNPEKPFCHRIAARYTPVYRKTNFVTCAITSHQVERLLEDPRLSNFARGENHMIWTTLPPYVKLSICKDKVEQFEDFVKEILGEKVYRDQVMQGGFNIQWSDKCDLDEVEQDEAVIREEATRNQQADLLKFNEQMQPFFDEGILSYHAPGFQVEETDSKE